MRSIASFVLVAVAAVGMGGCRTAAVRSEAAGPGVSYYLPMRLLKVTYSRASPATDATKRLLKAQAAVDAASKAADDAKSASDDAEKRRLAANPTSPAYAQLEKEAAYQVVLLKLATEALTAAQKAVDTSTKAVQDERNPGADPNKCTLIEQIEFATGAPTADRRHHYVAQVDHSVWRHDQVNLQTTKDGLLTNGTATLTDESNGILVSLLSSIANVRTLSTGRVSVVPDSSVAPPPKCEPASFEVTVDPADLGIVNQMLKERDSKLEIRWDAIAPRVPAPSPKETASTADAAAPAVPSPDTPPGGSASGLVYRRDQTWLLDVERVDGGRKRLTSVPILLPNFSPVERIELNATSFATNVHTLTFDNGMLTQAQTDQPSELLAVAKVPANIISGVLTSVATIIQLRVNVGTQSTALANQERLLACALDKLEAARTDTDPRLAATLCGGSSP